MLITSKKVGNIFNFFIAKIAIAMFVQSSFEEVVLSDTKMLCCIKISPLSFRGYTFASNLVWLSSCERKGFFPVGIMY